MNDKFADFLERIGKLNIYKNRDFTAPHKPLYLLFLISMIQRYNQRLIDFNTVEKCLSKALKLFAPNTGNIRPQYPYWRLQNDQLSEVDSVKLSYIENKNIDPNIKDIRNSKGGLLKADFDLLNGNLEYQSIVIRKLIDENFPSPIHNDIINFFDLEIVNIHLNQKHNHQKFKSNVLAAYDWKCSISGFSAKFDEHIIGIEATHLRWPHIGEDDSISNGIAMSTILQNYFHLGLISINKDYTLCISKYLNCNSPSKISVYQYDGDKINLPESKANWPDLDALTWHKKWIFRS